MSAIQLSRGVALIVASGIVGLGVGGGAVAFASTERDDRAVVSKSSTRAVTHFKINAKGETVGDYVIGQERPDLIPVPAATTARGQDGYVYLKDLLWESAKTPAEAVRITREHVNAAGEVVVPVYDFEGKTTIGSFIAATVTQ